MLECIPPNTFFQNNYPPATGGFFMMKFLIFLKSTFYYVLNPKDKHAHYN